MFMPMPIQQYKRQLEDIANRLCIASRRAIIYYTGIWVQCYTVQAGSSKKQNKVPHEYRSQCRVKEWILYGIIVTPHTYY